MTRTIYDVGGCYFCDQQMTSKVDVFPVCPEHRRYFERLREHRDRRRATRAA